MIELWASALVSSICAYVCVRKDVRRRRLPVSAIAVVAWTVISAAGAALYARFAPTSAHATVASSQGSGWFACCIAGAIAIALFSRYYKVPYPIMFDVAATAAALALAAAILARLVSTEMATVASATLGSGIVWNFKVAILESAAFVLICWFLWHEGEAAMQWQRPNGLLTGEFLVLSGAVLLAAGLMRDARAFRIASADSVASILTIAVGGVITAVSLSRYFGTTEEHRILDHVDHWGDAVQPEYTPATPECPNPQRWRMYDSMTAEVETLEFLRCLMTTMKPNLVVETGSFAGMSTVAMAEGIQQNGFGKIVTCELDERVFKTAKERIDKSGLGTWVEYRNESSLDMKVDGTIDILFSDSEQSIREQEVRKFLPQISPNGLILIHDAASCYKFVREGALRMEAEGLISVVLVPTARGLVIAQKREGRR